MFPRVYNMYSSAWFTPMISPYSGSYGPGTPCSLNQGALLRATWTWPILVPCNSGYQASLPPETSLWIEKYKFENTVDLWWGISPRSRENLGEKRTKILFTAMMAKDHLSTFRNAYQSATSNFLEAIEWIPSDLGNLSEFNSSNKFWVGVSWAVTSSFPLPSQVMDLSPRIYQF